MDEATPVDWNRIVNDTGPSFVEEFDGYYEALFEADDADDICGDFD